VTGVQTCALPISNPFGDFVAPVLTFLPDPAGARIP